MAVDNGNHSGIPLPVNRGIFPQTAKGNAVRSVADQMFAFPEHNIEILFTVTESAASGPDHGNHFHIAVFLHKLKGAQGRGKPAQMQPAV